LAEFWLKHNLLAILKKVLFFINPFKRRMFICKIVKKKMMKKVSKSRDVIDFRVFRVI